MWKLAQHLLRLSFPCLLTHLIDQIQAIIETMWFGLVKNYDLLILPKMIISQVRSSSVLFFVVNEERADDDDDDDPNEDDDELFLWND